MAMINQKTNAILVMYPPMWPNRKTPRGMLVGSLNRYTSMKSIGSRKEVYIPRMDIESTALKAVVLTK